VCRGSCAEQADLSDSGQALSVFVIGTPVCLL
jgi:hypothetical protein